MKIEEITLEKLEPKRFIEEQCAEIARHVGDGLAINALSGGVDFSLFRMPQAFCQEPEVAAVGIDMRKR